MSPRWRFYLFVRALGLAVLLVASAASAGDPEALAEALRGLTSEDTDVVEKSMAKLAELGDPAAIPTLDALVDSRLKVGEDGTLFIEDATKHTIVNALTGAAVASPPPARGMEMSNVLRRGVLPVVAQLKLVSPDPEVRLAAAEELTKRGSTEVAPQLRAARDKEKVEKVRAALALALAKLDLDSEDRGRRLEALATLKAVGDSDVKGELTKLARPSEDGTYAEKDEQVRVAAAAALGSIESRERIVSLFGDLVHGISLGSVLLFAALGLAVTFGLMGVINMAHGEMLMLGAYATYAMQTFFEKNLPTHQGWYLLAAIPLAFLVTMLVGMILERAVIRFLYGRQLETLLATWGISLGIIQTVRLIYGAQNVAVANPDWLAGGAEIAHGLVLPYSRMAVVGFVILVSLAMWALLWRTSLGIKVRAVTQNRGMAACIGVRTARLDTLVFGLGSGIAGLGGVALSQLGNVGPELGQSYIIDSFMVVVLGGVGRLAGTLTAALGLGIVNKLLEPFAGAVLGKIVVLMLVILFIQRRPEGMFAVKGRVEA
jgi:urea transport system permease protein